MTEIRGRCRRTVAALALAATAIGLLACEDAGGTRVLGVEASGVVGGFVYVDVNGSRRFEPASDSPIGNVIVRLLVRGTSFPVATSASNQAGEFTMERVPVGNFVVDVDSATVGDSVEVVLIENMELTVGPDDTVGVVVTVGFPIVTTSQARGLTIGDGVFVEGVALNDAGVFGDSTLNVADTSGAIRATRVSRVTVTAGDSVRLRATVGARSGQPTLDLAFPLVLAISSVPPATSLTSAEASTARDGAVDAALARVADVTISDTATVGKDFVASADDGSGTVDIVFDGDIPFNVDAYVPGAIITAVGLLVPTGLGTWVVKPRSAADVVLQ